MPGKYFSQNFDPILISTQIVLLFSLHNILLIFFTILFNKFLGLHLHIDQILSSENIDFKGSYGYSCLLSHFFTYFFMMAAYIKIVDKAYKIVDYILTNFFLHLICTTLNSNFPFNFLWWAVNGLFVTIVTFVSEYISLRLDQREIKLDFKFESKNKI